MSLLLGLAMAAAVSSGSPAAPAPPTPAPLVTRACARPRLTCRRVESFGVLVSPTQAIEVKVGQELEYTVADNLALMMGESVVFKIDKGALTLVSSGKAPMAQLALLIKSAVDKTPPAPPTPNQIRISLLQPPGRTDVLLFVENGYADKGLTYKANIVAVNNSELPTNVCPAAPGKTDIEQWPFAFPTIHLSGFRQVDKAGSSC